MRDFIAKISLTALFVLAIFSASAAEKVTFEANSPLTVAVGEPFRVEFALNAQPEPGSFKAPSFEGFDVIAGPAEAQGQSIQIVNNSMTRVVNYTITYVLVPQGDILIIMWQMARRWEHGRRSIPLIRPVRYIISWPMQTPEKSS